jgi:hypothetical protein
MILPIAEDTHGQCTQSDLTDSEHLGNRDGQRGLVMLACSKEASSTPVVLGSPAGPFTEDTGITETFIRLRC